MNTELVTIENDQLVTTTAKIADVFHKRHDHLLRTVEEQYGGLPNFGEMFFEGSYVDDCGREQKTYHVNRDGFSLLVMGFTGKKALNWKLKYIAAFNAMEKELNSHKLGMPNFNDPATAARAWADQYDARRIAEAEKECLQIELDRSKEYYSIKRVAAENNVPWYAFDWRRLKKISQEIGRAVKKIFDANYGEVNVYHADAWAKAYPKTKL